MGKAAAPVSMDDAIYDQASRYGLGLDEYLRGSSNTYTAGSDLPATFEQGNPFFTGMNQPTIARTQTTNIDRPFIWQGNNKSLRSGYQASFNAFQQQNPKKPDFEQYATWQGPEIRPEYTEQPKTQSNGLSFLGTPDYWQDNNKNKIYEANIDDRFKANQNQFIGAKTPVTAPQWAMPQPVAPSIPEYRGPQQHTNPSAPGYNSEAAMAAMSGSLFDSGWSGANDYWNSQETAQSAYGNPNAKNFNSEAYMAAQNGSLFDGGWSGASDFWDTWDTADSYGLEAWQPGADNYNPPA